MHVGTSTFFQNHRQTRTDLEVYQNELRIADLCEPLGYDSIWFGVVIVIVIEMGLISPPVGVNVFVVKGIAEDVPLKEIFAGIIPFWFAMAVCLLILLAFPEIALFLPDTMIQSFD